jgi:PAS domain S-box-containing protein/putative nucleotidyltransferase with HDIG domain
MRPQKRARQETCGSPAKEDIVLINNSELQAPIEVISRPARTVSARLKHWRKLGVPTSAITALAALLFAGFFLWANSTADVRSSPQLLYVIPIALCAMAFGMTGGIFAGAVATALLVVWNTSTGADLDPAEIVTRASAFLVLGGMLGRFVDVSRKLHERSSRYYALSRDLLCTATFDGYFEWVNPAWEETLGYSREELLSRPFSEFVHPDDREDTDVETERLLDQNPETHKFRNRYRTSGGSYVWLEWNTRVVPEERRFYAAARDITQQKEAEEALDNQATQLEVAVVQRTSALEESRLETLRRLALAAEYRDDATHEHTERVGRNSALIARRLGLPDAAVALIRRAAPLHDIGKLGIADRILHKEGELTPEEYRTMQDHTLIGAKILADPKFEILQMAKTIAVSHHERWDGSGYPHGLRGEQIPLSGRIVAVADVFDALTQDRSYKPAWSATEAAAEIKRLAGQQFDPRVVRAFEALDCLVLVAPLERYDLDLPAPRLVAAETTALA